MPQTSQRQGEFFALALTLIEAWFPIFATFTVVALGALHAYFYSSLVAAVFLLAWWIYRGKVFELKNNQAWVDLAWVSLFITVLFLLVFLGLQYTSATNVAIILFLQVLFSYVFLGRRAGESMLPKHIWGAMLMGVGAMLVLFHGQVSLNMGDGLVLLASIIAPFANLFQKRARAKVSSETILLVRTVVALPFIYVLAIWFEPTPNWQTIQQQAVWLLLTGMLVFFVAKVLWVEAIHLLPITKVNALYAFAPLMTMGLAYWVLKEIPTLSQLLGILPILLGGYLITRKT